MQTNKKRKGFTLVELLVVIAILAILATVTVVGYIGFTNKANQSADEQAVTQMNTLLEANEKNDGKNVNLNDVIAELGENNLDVSDYKPLVKNTYFYWDATLNRIIIANENDEVIYPEKYVKDTTVKYEMGRWSSLSGAIPTSDAWESESTKTNGVYTNVNISNGKELYSFMTEINKTTSIINSTTTVQIDEERIDLMGASWYAENLPLNEIKGVDGGTSISNFYTRQAANVQNIPAYGGTTKYSWGFIGEIPTGTTVTLSNLIFDGVQIGNPDDPYDNTRISGVVAGRVLGTLNLNNVHVTNSSVRGYQKMGGFVGYVREKGTLNMTNCSISNTTITTYCTEAAIIAGAVKSTGTINGAQNVTIGENVNVIFDEGLHEDGQTIEEYTNQSITGDFYEKKTVDKKTSWVKTGESGTYTLDGKYSVFSSTLYGTVAKYYFKEYDRLGTTINGNQYINGSYAVNDLNNIPSFLTTE